MRDYHINLFWSEEDGQWVADIPDLKGCSATGATPEEAAKEIQIARDLWLQSAKEHGDPIPEPIYHQTVKTP